MERLPGSPGCFVCDNDNSNPRSLRLHLMWDEAEGKVHVTFHPDETWCGYSGIVHGGILASVFDDVMAWAVRQDGGNWGVTADFHIRYRKPVTSGGEYTVEGWVETRRGRKAKTAARLLDSKGDLLAEADALFIGGTEAKLREKTEA